MGGSSWSDDFYRSSANTRAITGESAFAHTDSVRKGHVAANVHADLNPIGITRESRDSDEHKNSNAIAVMFDVTGSMGHIPVKLQEKLAELMGLLIKKDFIDDPQILFGAIGDYRAGDKAPMQIGQFESGNEIEGDLSKIYIEGAGGGNSGESYDLAMYFFANNTSIDCLEKRNTKGYLFTIGDEPFFSVVRRADVKAVFGDDIENDLPIKQVVDKLKESYTYFHILPTGAYHSSRSKEHWVDLLGQNVLMLDDDNAVCETIAMAIGINQNSIDVDELVVDLTDTGFDKNLVTAALKATSSINPDRAMVSTSVSGLPKQDDTDGTARL